MEYVFRSSIPEPSIRNSCSSDRFHRLQNKQPLCSSRKTSSRAGEPRGGGTSKACCPISTATRVFHPVTGPLLPGDQAAVEWEAVLVDRAGKRFPIYGVNLVRIRDGKFTHVRAYYGP